jgi:carboxypeptidase C (cathepsin A)
VETGFAFSEGHTLVQDEKHLSRDFYGFIRNFLGIFPEFRPNRLYIFGESYAGMYGPAVAHQIHARNLKETEENRVNIQVRGRLRKRSPLDSRYSSVDLEDRICRHIRT